MAEEKTDIQEELKAKEQKALEKLKEIRRNVSEDDTVPVGTLTLRKILGGDILSADLVRRNIWTLVLIVFFTVVYVAFRYQCQQDMIQIDKMERELKDAKYKALSSSSTLTERCRESQVLKVLRENHDSLLHISSQPPYIINIPERGFLSGNGDE
jgi:hypothetical protein